MSSNLPSIPVQDGSLLPTGKTPRKRGGQPGNSNALCRGAPVGNTNALKHGFYSHTFSQPEIDRLDDDVRGELKDEEDFLRVLLGVQPVHQKPHIGQRRILGRLAGSISCHRSRRKSSPFPETPV